jgi:hypothetical protein
LAKIASSCSFHLRQLAKYGMVEEAGARWAVNYGMRPVGALAGGALGTLAGVRPMLWIAAAGGIAGAVAAALPAAQLPAT